MRISFKKSINKLELHVDIVLLKIFSVTNLFLYFDAMYTDTADI